MKKGLECHANMCTSVCLQTLLRDQSASTETAFFVDNRDSTHRSQQPGKSTIYFDNKIKRFVRPQEIPPLIKAEDLPEDRKRKIIDEKIDVNDIKKPRTGAEPVVFAVPMWGGSRYGPLAPGEKNTQSQVRVDQGKVCQGNMSLSQENRPSVRPSSSKTIPSDYNCDIYDSKSTFCNPVSDMLQASTSNSSQQSSTLMGNFKQPTESSQTTQKTCDYVPATPSKTLNDSDYFCTFTPLDLRQHHDTLSDDEDKDIDENFDTTADVNEHLSIKSNDSVNDSANATADDEDSGYRDIPSACYSVQSHYEDISDSEETEDVSEGKEQVRQALGEDEDTRISDAQIENMASVVNHVALMTDLQNMPESEENSPQCSDDLLEMAENNRTLPLKEIQKIEDHVIFHEPHGKLQETKTQSVNKNSCQSKESTDNHSSNVINESKEKSDETYLFQKPKKHVRTFNKENQMKIKARNRKLKDTAPRRHCKDGMVCFAQVGKNAKLWILEHPLVRGIFLNKGKRDVKKKLVNLRRQNSAVDTQSYFRGGIINDRNRLDDYFEFTEEGKELREMFENNLVRDEYVVSWYMWCPGHGNCQRRCGGYGKCAPGKRPLHPMDAKIIFAYCIIN